MNAHRFARSLALAVVACTAALLPAGAWAQCEQTGSFTAFADPWHAANGTVGYFLPNASTMVVDSDGDGTTSTTDPEDHVFTVPTAIQSNRLTTVLSPTREFLVVVGGTAAASCDSNRSIRIYHLDNASGTMTLVHEDCLPCTVFEGPLFYDLGVRPPYPFTPAVTGQRLVMFRTGAGSCNPNFQAPPLLRWYDLNTPGPSGIADTALGLQPGINPNTLQVSPTGYQAFVQHDLSNNPADSDFDIINLCPGPNFGVIIPNAIGPPINDYSGFPLPTPLISSATTNTVTLQMTVNNSVIYQATVPNCCASAPTGACCANGGCVVTTHAQCSGTWTAGLSCEQAQCPPPPAPNISVTMTGPAVVEQRGFVDYVLTYRNDGGAAAQSVVVRDQLPSTFTFVSAGNGGTYNQAQNEVTWTIGTLAAQSGPLTLTFRAQAGCGIAFNSNYNFSISGTGLYVNGSPNVQTYVTAATVTGSVSGSISTSTTASPPLLPGSVLHHELILTNTSAVPLSGIRFSGAAGVGAQFTALVNAGTGTLSLPFGGGTNLQWIGDLAPSQTTTILFDSTINSCTSGGDTQTQLNSGSPWTVTTNCGATLGSFPTSQPFMIQSPMSASLSAAPQPNAVGPLVAGSAVYRTPMQFVRGTPVIDLALAVSNATGANITSASLTLQLPFSWIIADPPFVGAVTPGYSYDPNSYTISYDGDVPSSGLPPLTIRVQPDVPISGTVNLGVQRSVPNLCTVTLAQLSLVNLPALPAGPVIVGVEKFYQPGLWTIRPGIDTQPSFFFNRSEVWRGLHKEPNGDLWLAGGPVFMINPDTLNAASAPGVAEFLQGLGLGETDCCDLAVDPTDGTLVIMVDQRTDTNNITHPPALVRYNRATATCTLITRDPALRPTNHHADVLIDAAGTIYIANRQVLARIPRVIPIPIADGQVPLLAVPQPGYTFASGAGTLTTQRVHAAGWSCDGHMLLLHASTFAGGTSPDGFSVDTQLYALSTYDPATNTITIAQPQLAANAYGQGYRPCPAAFAPQLPLNAILDDSCIAGGEAGEVLLANNYYPYHSIYAVSLSSGEAAPVEAAQSFHIRGAADIAYFHGACNSVPPCSADFNGDGDVGTDADIEAFFACLAGNCCITCGSADFNGDGDVGTDADIEAFFRVLAGGSC